jgi:hypothetical protein
MRIVLHVLAHLILLAFGVGIPLLVYYWLRSPLESTISRLTEMSEATDFYLRAFLITLLFGGLGVTFGPLGLPTRPIAPPPPGPNVTAPPHLPIPPHPPPPPHIIDYLGPVAHGVGSIVDASSHDILFFVGVITFLATILMLKQWQTKGS